MTVSQDRFVDSFPGPFSAVPVITVSMADRFRSDAARAFRLFSRRRSCRPRRPNRPRQFLRAAPSSGARTSTPPSHSSLHYLIFPSTLPLFIRRRPPKCSLTTIDVAMDMCVHPCATVIHGMSLLSPASSLLSPASSVLSPSVLSPSVLVPSVPSPRSSLRVFLYRILYVYTRKPQTDRAVSSGNGVIHSCLCGCIHECLDVVHQVTRYRLFGGALVEVTHSRLHASSLPYTRTTGLNPRYDASTTTFASSIVSAGMSYACVHTIRL